MKFITLVDATRNTVLGNHIAVADTFLTRLVGLLGKKRLEPESGLLIDRSSGVHTFAMRFPIDVIALDRHHRVQGIWHALRPWRLSGVSWRYHSVVELPSGQIRRCRVEIGDQLEFTAATAAKAGVPNSLG